MAELSTIFASIDANKNTRATDDRNDLLNDTFDFGTDVLETYGLYFIAEGDERGTDKINVNFKIAATDVITLNSSVTSLNSSVTSLNSSVTSLNTNFITITNDYTASTKDFIYADTISNIIEITLPADNNSIVDILDTKSNFSTNNLTITPDGSDTIMGNADMVLSTDDEHVELILVDGDWRLL